jgi:GAF domain-containing protein
MNTPAVAADDIHAIADIPAIQRILEVASQVTGMGFASVARVTKDRWIACAIYDTLDSGLEPGAQLDIKTTICDEVRSANELVAIDHVDEDLDYCGHPAPEMYGFQSYISVPIRRPDGTFFGTLCALDPKPATVNTPQIIAIFELFTDIIGEHLTANPAPA